MDGGYDTPSPSDMAFVPACPDGEASKFLANLPSRGHLSSTVVSTNQGGMRVYICDHDTSPPEDQVIRTNQTNILIRSLLLKNPKGESNSKDGKGTAAIHGSRKRAAEKPLENKAALKKTNSSNQLSSSLDLQSLTVEKLRAALREKGLSAKGRKDELIARLRGAR
ncbi:uncharacterized protein LOC127241568 [Andrographis paniculata]|uniref:uncharacterized protein LOC127241568 n=1 Tax=Andrographis paniculata TaxID=175694 RepID=UPI0021E74D75|nr:uncharacterized protein LOC127241568 [Andrographis paniculata]